MTNDKKPTESETAVRKLVVKPSMANDQTPAPELSKATQNENLKLQTRSQIYAAAVYEKVKAIEDDKAKSDPYKEKYTGMARKLPILIQSAGLAQALAFVDSKTDEMAWRDLLKDLEAVVGQTKGKSLRDASRSKDLDLLDYMHLTRKTVGALLWFKRFAESVLEVKSKISKTTSHEKHKLSESSDTIQPEA